MSFAGGTGDGTGNKRAQKRSDEGLFMVFMTCDQCPHSSRDEAGWRKCKLINCASCVIDQRAQIASWACPDGRFGAERV